MCPSKKSLNLIDIIEDGYKDPFNHKPTQYKRWSDFKRWYLNQHLNLDLDPVDYFQILLDDKDIGICRVCKKKRLKWNNKRGFQDSCSRECVPEERKKKLSETKKRLYSSNTWKQEVLLKEQETKIKRYGVKKEKITAKTKNTVKSKYGVENGLMIPHVASARNKSLTENKDSINKKRSAAWTDDLKKEAERKRLRTLQGIVTGKRFISS